MTGLFITGLWPHWSRPLWLLALPLLGWLLWKLAHRKKRAGRWQILLPPAFHAALLNGGHGRGSKLPWLALGLAWLLAILALLGPSWQRVEQNTQKPADPLVILLELTPQMLANDVPPSRLELARHKVLDLLQARSDAQTAIIVYAGSAHVLVPLSDDLATSRNLLDVVAPAIMPESGQRADLAVGRALDLLDQAAQGRGRVLWVGSALNETERQGIREQLDHHTGNQGLPDLRLLGVGTPQGAPVTQADGSFMKDANGAILLPQLDNPGLEAFAHQLSGRYRQARVDANDLGELGLLQGSRAMRDDGEPTRLDTWADQGYWLLLPLLLLAACAGRRGWLFGLTLVLFPVLMATPQQSQAFEFADLWLRPDQQGQQLLEQGRPADAASRFKDPAWQGIALYQAGDYAGAAQRFALGKRAADYYNLGNALARSGELEAALDAYARALEHDPQLRAARANMALVEEQLRLNEAARRLAQAQAAAATAEVSTTTATASDAPPGAAGQSQGQGQGQGGTPPAPVQPGNAQTNASDPALQAHSPPGLPASTGAPAAPGVSPDGFEQPGKPVALPASAGVAERQQALEQWLRQIPDNPGELLRRKFWYEQQQHQETRR